MPLFAKKHKNFLIYAPFLPKYTKILYKTYAKILRMNAFYTFLLLIRYTENLLYANCKFQILTFILFLFQIYCAEGARNSPLYYRVKPPIRDGYRIVQVQSGMGTELGKQFGCNTNSVRVPNCKTGSADAKHSNLVVKVR